MGTEQGTEISVLGKFGSVLGKICPGLQVLVAVNVMVHLHVSF